MCSSNATTLPSLPLPQANLAMESDSILSGIVEHQKGFQTASWVSRDLPIAFCFLVKGRKKEI